MTSERASRAVAAFEAAKDSGEVCELESRTARLIGECTEDEADRITAAWIKANERTKRER